MQTYETNDGLARRQMRWLPISSIQRNPYQPRKQMDAKNMDELAASIRTVGLLQPVTVRVIGKNRYELIAGERRLRACAMNGMSHIDAIVLPACDRDSALMAMVENLQREQLHFLEVAQGYEAILKSCEMSQNALAEQLGVSQSAVANKLRLLQLAPSIRAEIRKTDLGERHARALLRLEDEELQKLALERMVDKQLTVRQCDAMIDEMLRDIPRRHRRVLAVVRDHRPYVNAIREIVQQMVSTGVPAEVDVQEKPEWVEICVRMPRKNLAKDAVG